MLNKGKYKQSNIPKVDDTIFRNLKLGKLKTFVKEYFNQHLIGISVRNRHKGITVLFSRKGIDHLLYARKPGYIKLKAVLVLDEMISIAKYSNFKNSGQNDPPGVLGYLHFQCKVNIENENHNFRIVVRLTRNGKFYYDHSVRIQKRPRLSPGPNSQAT